MSNFILDRITRRVREEEKHNFKNFRPDLFRLVKRPDPIDVLHIIEKNFFVIAEAKKGSPSRGIIRHDFRPVDIALSYRDAGASAISVITEQFFFYGHKLYLQKVKKAVGLPVLRKDFLIHPFQVYESYNLGADFLLLIVACLTDGQLSEMYSITKFLGMEALIEVHTEEELERALRINPRLIGINNRNLKTFDVNIETSFRLKKQIPPGQNIYVISESGISSPEHIARLKEENFNGALIGESLLKQNDTGSALQELLKN